VRRDPLNRPPLTHADVDRRNNGRLVTSLLVIAGLGAVVLSVSWSVSTAWLVTLIVLEAAVSVGLMAWMLVGGTNDRARTYQGPWRD
jgi:hypothetical protein